MRLAPILLSLLMVGLPGDLQAARLAKKAVRGSVHKVRKGETAGKIARKAGLSLAELADLNPNVNLAKLSVGTPLKLKPLAAQAGAVGAVDLASLVPANPIPAIPVNGPAALVQLERLLPTSIDPKRPRAARGSGRSTSPLPAEDLLPVFPAKMGLDHDSNGASSLVFEPADPSDLELFWPVETRSISSAWGPRMRTRIVRVVKAKKRRKVRVRYQGSHKGVDLTAPRGSDVYAALSGEVVLSARHRQYGNYVILDHGNGVQTLYAHHRKNLVQVGDVVRQGDKIAEVGSTGRSTGPHLHFELRINGLHQNPLPLMNEEDELPAGLLAFNNRVNNRGK